jgi:hypothetical protein
MVRLEKLLFESRFVLSNSYLIDVGNFLTSSLSRTSITFVSRSTLPSSTNINRGNALRLPDVGAGGHLMKSKAKNGREQTLSLLSIFFCGQT